MKSTLQRVTVKVLSGIIAFVLVCTLLGMDNMVSLISVTILIVLISQYIGIENIKLKKEAEIIDVIYCFRFLNDAVLYY